MYVQNDRKVGKYSGVNMRMYEEIDIDLCPSINKSEILRIQLFNFFTAKLNSLLDQAKLIHGENLYVKQEGDYIRINHYNISEEGNKICCSYDIQHTDGPKPGDWGCIFLTEQQWKDILVPEGYEFISGQWIH
jgi:hypothetical protein